MKNPMDRQMEKRLSDRAVAIGREGDVAAFGELIELLRSSSAGNEFMKLTFEPKRDKNDKRR